MRRGLILPASGILLALGLLVGLGTWQLQRLQWKLGLMAQIETRTHADPIELAEVDRQSAGGQNLEYLRVRATGHFAHDREIHLYATGPDSWGWDILTPLVTADGRQVLVNRGFVPDALKDPAKRAGGLPAGEVSVVGLVRVPLGQQQNFIPDNEPTRNRWYWLDPAALLQPPLRPFVLEAERSPSAVPPEGGVTRLELSNPHLGYALTWYALAATLAVMSGLWLAKRLR